MNDGQRVDDRAGSHEPPLETAPSRHATHLRLVASFALSTLGAVLLPLYLAFTLSVALFVAAAGLVFSLATQHPARRVRTMARIALAAALIGVVSYLVLLGLYFRASTETGFDALLASGGFLLGLFTLRAIVSSLRSRSSS